MTKKIDKAIEALAAVENTAENCDLLREIAELLEAYLKSESLDFSTEQEIEVVLRKTKEIVNHS